MWIVYALLSAVFAALTTIFAKVGITGVNSTLATAIRTVVVLAAAWGMVFITGTQRGIGGITPRGWLFLALSGLATGASWLCYYKALQIGDTARVESRLRGARRPLHLRRRHHRRRNIDFDFLKQNAFSRRRRRLLYRADIESAPTGSRIIAGFYSLPPDCRRRMQNSRKSRSSRILYGERLLRG